MKLTQKAVLVPGSEEGQTENRPFLCITSRVRVRQAGRRAGPHAARWRRGLHGWRQCAGRQAARRRRGMAEGRGDVC